MKGKWNSSFSKIIILSFSNWDAENEITPVGLAQESILKKIFIGVDIKGARMWTGAKDSLGKRYRKRCISPDKYRAHYRIFRRKPKFQRSGLHFPIPNEKSPEKTHFNPFYGSIPANT